MGKRIDWRWTATRRRRFLAVLAETYDIEAALAAGKLTWPDVCELRARHPDFAERFEEVIAAGYDRLEAMLLRTAGIGAGAAPDAALAQALIKLRRTRRAEPAGGASAGRGQLREQRIQEVMAMIAPLKAARAGGMPNGAQADAAGR